MNSLQLATWRILQPSADAGPVNRSVNAGLLFLILANVIAVILESVDDLSRRHSALFGAFETFSVAVFSAEYVLRLWSCTADPRYRRTISGRVRFALTPLALIDLIAVLPFFLPLVLPMDTRVVRIARLLRLLRILKTGRYSEALATLGRVIRAKSADLLVVVAFAVAVLVIAASLMYSVENEAQPEVFSSIPASMWWSIVTLTTVGYGDTYPITALGKVLGAIIAFIGVGVVALPAGIIGSGFVEEMQRKRKERDVKRCPHCGEALGDSWNDEVSPGPKLESTAAKASISPTGFVDAEL